MENRRLWIWIGVALVAGLAIGGGVIALTVPAPAPQATFTVVAHHWGFVIYDEDGTEVPRIEAARGTEVTLLVMGAEALSHAIHGQFMDRTIAAWENNTQFGGKTGLELRDLIEEAENQGLEDHSVMISGYDLNIPAVGDSASPTIVTFLADTAGTFDIQCNQFCGWGHQFMKLEGGFVVS
ncbi:MAG: hypothetical protein ACE5JE_04085 [Thermoplasmata archaeon]